MSEEQKLNEFVSTTDVLENIIKQVFDDEVFSETEYESENMEDNLQTSNHIAHNIDHKESSKISSPLANSKSLINGDVSDSITTDIDADSSDSLTSAETRPTLRRKMRETQSERKRVSFKEEKDLVQIRSISPDAHRCRENKLSCGYARLVTDLPIEHLKVTDFLQSIGVQSYVDNNYNRTNPSVNNRSYCYQNSPKTLYPAATSSNSRFSSFRQGGNIITSSASYSRPFSAAFQSNYGSSIPNLPGFSSRTGQYQRSSSSAQSSSALIAVRRLASSRDTRLTASYHAGSNSTLSRFGRL